MRDKNEALEREREGIFVVERGPLDPISFAEPAQLRGKAQWYKARLVPTAFDHITRGAVVLLWGDTVKVSARIASRQPIQQSPEYLAELQSRLRSVVYTGGGVRELQSTEWSISQMVRAVAELIHLEKYEPVDLDSRLAIISS